MLGGARGKTVGPRRRPGRVVRGHQRLRGVSTSSLDRMVDGPAGPAPVTRRGRLSRTGGWTRGYRRRVSRMAMTASRLITATATMYPDTDSDVPVEVCSQVAISGANPPPSTAPTA